MKEMLERKLALLQAEREQLLITNDEEAVAAQVAEYKQSLLAAYAKQREDRLNIIAVKSEVLVEMLADAAAAAVELEPIEEEPIEGSYNG